MESLDVKDRKILFELDRNARQSDSAIARRVGLSRDVVRYRIAKLQERGIINYFMTLLDTMKLGYDMYRIYLRTQNLTTQREAEMLSWMKDNMCWVTEVSGKWNLNSMIFARTTFEARDFMNEFLLHFREEIDEYEISIVTRMWHYHRHYLLDDKKVLEPEMMGVHENTPRVIVKTDDKDYALLQTIVKNARMPTLEIARTIGVSETNARHRLKRLEKEEVILGYRAFLNIGALGYKYFKLHIGLRSYSIEQKRAIVEYLAQHPNTVYLNELLNGHDLEPEFQLWDIDELHEHIRDLRERFGDIIRYYEILQYVKEHKFTYLPETPENLPKVTHKW